MQVDRVSQMGGVRREAVSVWPTAARRKRRFVAELEPELDPEAELETDPEAEPEPDTQRIAHPDTEETAAQPEYPRQLASRGVSPDSPEPEDTDPEQSDSEHSSLIDLLA